MKVIIPSSFATAEGVFNGSLKPVEIIDALAEKFISQGLAKRVIEDAPLEMTKQEPEQKKVKMSRTPGKKLENN